MLDQLESLTASLSTYLTDQGQPPVMFGYGTSAELNVLADKVGASFLLFHDGYFLVSPRITPGGSIQETHNLTLLLFHPSRLSDSPVEKREVMDLLMPVYQRLFLMVDALGQVQNAQATANFSVNRTDRNMNGIRLTLSLSLDAVSLC